MAESDNVNAEKLQPQPFEIVLQAKYCPIPELSDGVVHVWFVDVERPWESPERLLGCLNDAEQARYERYTHRDAKRQFLVSRGCLKLLLKQSVNPVILAEAPQGKPYLRDHPIHFNVAHSGGKIAISVANRRIGIDLERLRLMPNAEALVRRFFSKREHDQYLLLPESKRNAAFFRGWTQKEALLKAVGVGLKDLESVAVDLDPSRPESVLYYSHEPVPGRRWCVRNQSIDGLWLLAAAMETVL